MAAPNCARTSPKLDRLAAKTRPSQAIGPVSSIVRHCRTFKSTIRGKKNSPSTAKKSCQPDSDDEAYPSRNDRSFSAFQMVSKAA